MIGVTREPDGFLDGVVAIDRETGREIRVAAKVVINATAPLIAPSQGVHLVFDRSFLPGQSAIMVPHTRDGRVMFAIPWHGHTLVGTTDTPIAEPALEPRALDEGITFIQETAGRYLHRAPVQADVMAAELGHGEDWQRREVTAFTQLASQYRLS